MEHQFAMLDRILNPKEFKAVKNILSLEDLFPLLKGSIVSFRNNLYFQQSNEWFKQSPIVIFKKSNKSFCYFDYNENDARWRESEGFLLQPLIKKANPLKELEILGFIPNKLDSKALGYALTKKEFDIFLPTAQELVALHHLLKHDKVYFPTKDKHSMLDKTYSQLKKLLNVRLS